MKLRIRKANVRDVKGCLGLQKSHGEIFWKRDNFVRAVEDRDVIFLVAEENGKILGCILGFINLVKRDEAYLQETRVHKKEERRGIGKALVGAFCKFAKRKGVKEIYSEIEKEHIPFYIKSCKFKDRGKHILILKKLS